MMEPFNIKVGYGVREITLTILLAEEGYYKVIYFGGILGAVYFDGEDWDLVPHDKVIAGDLPVYKPGYSGERIEIDLSEYVVERIGREIELHFDDDDML